MLLTTGNQPTGRGRNRNSSRPTPIEESSTVSARNGPSPIDFEEQFGVNAGYVEQVFAEYRARPDAVSDEWRRFFDHYAQRKYARAKCC